MFAHGGRRSRVLVREILLCCEDVPLVFAHTVVDRSSLRSAWRNIAVLGERPLGAAIFSERRIVRGPLRQRRIRPNHPLFRETRAAVPQAVRSLWARRSLFELRGEPILVTEVFLPGILEL
jgi:chorismate--pyruvate lyase